MEAINKRVNLLRILLSVCRHRWLVYFRPHYTILSLLNRKGKCLACGRCCFLNKSWCRYFYNNKCQIYKKQPFFCRIFPIDEKDKQMSEITEVCGYYWDDKNLKWQQ